MPDNGTGAFRRRERVLWEEHRMADPPYRRVHVVVNPAAGKDEPILNTLNDVFVAHGVDWDMSVTHRYGDAAAQARAAIEAGVDLVAGYGGDGTQHEIANAVVQVAAGGGRSVAMGVLPGGTGNGFARELGVPAKLRPATEILCTSRSLRRIDVGRIREIASPRVPDRFFIQRMFVGIEPEQQTSRDLKDRYGVFAYAMSAVSRHDKRAHYRAVADGDPFEFDATKVYAVNSGMMGTGVRITHTYAIDDGLLDCFALDDATHETLLAAAERLLNLDTKTAAKYLRQSRSITLDTTPDLPVWTDGEYVGRTPVSVDVVPGALAVVVP
jgi:YegS/Rv2252/BmrU family lipid kinase